jgi:hypothetical protein
MKINFNEIQQQTEHIQQQAPNAYNQYGQLQEHQQQQTPITYNQYGQPPQEHQQLQQQQQASDFQSQQGYTQNTQAYTQGMDTNAGVDPNSLWQYQQGPHNGIVSALFTCTWVIHNQVVLGETSFKKYIIHLCFYVVKMHVNILHQWSTCNPKFMFLKWDVYVLFGTVKYSWK